MKAPSKTSAAVDGSKATRSEVVRHLPLHGLCKHDDLSGLLTTSDLTCACAVTGRGRRHVGAGSATTDARAWLTRGATFKQRVQQPAPGAAAGPQFSSLETSRASLCRYRCGR
jgi:hypothetical protein